MRITVRQRTVRLLAITVVGIGLAGGIAYATIPGAGNVYTACMLKNIGTIRLIDPSLPAKNLMGHCTGAETPISWNQVGQQGPAGATGATGPSGSSGAPHAYFATNSHVADDEPNGQQIVGLTLPAGSYEILSTFHSEPAANSIGEDNDYCYLGGASPAYPGPNDPFGDLPANNGMALSEVVTVNAGDVVALYCNDIPQLVGGAPTVIVANMSAITVGAVN